MKKAPNAATAEVIRQVGYSIADILESTVEQALGILEKILM